ncbi:DMT family transporter [Paracoccus aestuariivivens]|uniref:EamA family transporter n=1 Tax=Paracoccus aestuariivivens TaxID=1820333 RepID=A0A6L6JB45_9RHOB|nr:DMT family transporter [Paracoccus aestuariivivens]MTH78726.1 EamA family transporter [Paracoccus aestuariivivens]
MERIESLRGHAAMLLFSVLIAGSFSLGARAANLIDPTAISAARFAIAAGAIAGLAMAGPGIQRDALLRAPWRYLLLGGLFAAYFVLMFEGLKTALPVSAAAVFTLTPVMSAGFGWLLLRQHLTGRLAVALALGAAGSLWVIFRGDLAALSRLDFGRGEAIYLLGCVAHALYTPLVRRLNRGETPLISTLGTLIAGSVILGIWGWRAIIETDWAHLPALVWITLIYVAICASAITTLLVQYATMRLPSAKVMAYTYLTPAWVLLLESALTGQAPAPIMLPGFAVTIVALLLLLQDQRH